MRNRKWKFYFVLLVSLLVIIILIIRIRKNQSAAEISAEINPVYGNVQTYISTTGDVEPQNRLEVKPPISGRIENVLVKEGEKVEVGQVLAMMSSTERAALLDAARSQGAETFKYWQEAYKPVPLLAPINGEVIVKAVEPGQTITPADPVVVLSDRLIVKAQVDETDIGKVKLGQAAVISLDAYPQMKVKGRVDHISYESKIVNNVTIYEVDILPERVPPVFRSGMSANVDIIDRSKENVLTIPLEAVVRNGKTFVFLSRGKDKPVKQKVELGLADEKNVEVLSGLDPSIKILVKGIKYVVPKNGKNGKQERNPFLPMRPRGR